MRRSAPRSRPPACRRPTVVATAEVQIRSGPVQLFARSGATAHVHVISGGGAGVWVPQSYARQHQVAPGRSLPTAAGTIRVAGVYRDLAPSAFVPLFHLPRYWCSWRAAIVPDPFHRPPPLFLTDTATLVRVAPTVDATWYAGTEVSRQTLPDARATLAAGRRAAAALPTGTFRFRSDLAYLLDKATRERVGLRGPVVPVGVAGVVVAAGLMAASGLFWALRRQREVRLLASRGVGPAAIGVKAALELGPAVAIGTLSGWLAGIGLVRLLGPSPTLERGAPVTALSVAVLTGVAGLAVAATLAAAGTPSGRRLPAWVSRVPWELALVAAAAYVYGVVHRDGAVHIVRATVQVNPLMVTFPLLALTGVTLLLARAGRAGLAPMAAAATRRSAAGYLAARRLAGTPAVAVGTLVGVALPIAILLYSTALSASTATDVQRKYETNVGAPVAFGTVTHGRTPHLDGHGTVVDMIQVDPLVNGRVPARVLALDPATFDDFASAGAAEQRLVARLSPERHRVAAVLVHAPADLEATSVRIRSVTIPIRVVGRAGSFPGLRDPFAPLIVVDRAALPALDRATDLTHEIWTTPPQVRAAVRALAGDGIEANYADHDEHVPRRDGPAPGHLDLRVPAGAGVPDRAGGAGRARLCAHRADAATGRRLSPGPTHGPDPARPPAFAGHRDRQLTAGWLTGAALAAGAVLLVLPARRSLPSLPAGTGTAPSAGLLAATALVAAVAGTWRSSRQHAADRSEPARVLRILTCRYAGTLRPGLRAPPDAQRCRQRQ